MDQMQMLRALGAPIPVAPPTRPGIGPGGTSPPIVTPPFLPGNLSNVVPLGKMPVPAGPTPIPMPSLLNVGDLMSKYAGAFEVPGIPEMQLPPASQRAMPTFADPSKMIAKMEGLRPQDHQLSEEEFGQKRFADSMAAAAMAAAGADNIGSLLAGAGGAFGATASGANEDRRKEAIMFEERNRAFDAEMANLQWDVDQARAEQANATSDVMHENAQAREAQAAQQLQLTLQQKESNRAALVQKLGMELDLLQFNTGQETQRAQIAAQNQDRQAAHQAKYEPNWTISEDGTTLTQTYLDPQTNKMVVHQEPVGVMGQLSQIAQLASTLPNGLGSEMMARGQYDNMARIAPQMFRRKLIMDILNTPGGEKVFEPEDAGTAGMNAGKADNAEDYFNVGKTLTDQFTTSDYERVVNKVSDFVNKQLEAGRWTPEQAAQQAPAMVAQQLEHMLSDPKTLARAKKLANPDITYGLGLMK